MPASGRASCRSGREWQVPGSDSGSPGGADKPVPADGGRAVGYVAGDSRRGPSAEAAGHGEHVVDVGLPAVGGQEAARVVGAELPACAAGRGRSASLRCSQRRSPGKPTDGDNCGGYSGYSEDTSVDNVSSPRPRSRRGYSEDTQIRAGDNGGSLCGSVKTERLGDVPDAPRGLGCRPQAQARSRVLGRPPVPCCTIAPHVITGPGHSRQHGPRSATSSTRYLGRITGWRRKR